MSTPNAAAAGTIDLGGSISDGATYTVANANSNLKLTIAGGSTTNGTFATQQNTDKSSRRSVNRPPTTRNTMWKFRSAVSSRS